jgi:hypothetical protein
MSSRNRRRNFDRLASLAGLVRNFLLLAGLGAGLGLVWVALERSQIVDQIIEGMKDLPELFHASRGSDRSQSDVGRGTFYFPNQNINISQRLNQVFAPTYNNLFNSSIDVTYNQQFNQLTYGLFQSPPINIDITQLTLRNDSSIVVQTGTPLLLAFLSPPISSRVGDPSYPTIPVIPHTPSPVSGSDTPPPVWDMTSTEDTFNREVPEVSDLVIDGAAFIGFMVFVWLKSQKRRSPKNA